MPGTPPPTVTVPTTTYKTRRALPRNLLPADFHRVRSSHQHFPLVVLLVLTQLSVGTFAADLVLAMLGDQTLALGRPERSLLALCTGLLALGASTFHLGRPFYAFRAVLGLRTSWMSREVVAFGAFAASAVAFAALQWIEPAARYLGVELPARQSLESLRSGLGAAVALSGTLGVFCSVMLYQVTSRRWWSAARTGSRFALTALLLGLSMTHLTLLAAAVLAGSAASAHAATEALTLPLVASALAKLLLDAEIFLHLRARGLGELKRTALLLVRELRALTMGRFLSGGMGILLAVLASQGGRSPGAALVLALASFACLLAGESLERALFFRGLSAPKMPGAVGP